MRTRIASLALLLLACVAACTEETTYDFDGVDVGADGSGRAPRERSNSQFIRAAYADLLGRTPESYELVITVNGTEAARFPVDEQQILLAGLDGVGDPAPMRSLVVSGLLASDEVDLPRKAEVDDPDGYITDQFRFFLGRDPNPYELATFADQWARDPAVGPRTVIRALMESREYQSY